MIPRVVVIGGGIAGLTAAWRLQQSAGDEPLNVSLVEASGRWGGKVVTDREDGFVIEGGPDSFIPQKPWALELVRELGLEDRLLPSNDGRGGTSILHRGRLVPVPEGLEMLAPRRLGPVLRSPLLSWPARLRFAAESLVPPRRSEGDESVADFVRRRLGVEVLERLAEPLLAHLHVADVERLSVGAAYPRLAQAESRFGSLRRAAAEAPAAPPGPMFWTLRDGLEELIDALVRRLDPATLFDGHRVESLRRSADGASYVVRIDDGREFEAEAVVLATPASAAADLVAGVDSHLASRLRAIPHAAMATLSLGYRRSDLPPLEGFGFFVPGRARPGRERRPILAASWSRKFDHRAPPDRVLVRLFVGGVLHPEILELDDGALMRSVEQDLQEILGFEAEPVLRRLYRWPRGYPQYEVGHRERVREIEAALPSGLFVAGNAYRGIGLPDCIRLAGEAADRVRRHLEDRGESERS